MDRFRELLRHGQSYWLDNLSRAMLRDGSLARRVEREGLRGVTSNPAIFEKAIAGTNLYDEQIRELAPTAASIGEIYEALVVSDVRDACDVLRPVWRDSDGLDGYVSLEVSPHRIHDTPGSIEEGRRLWAEVDRPNLMIKIPGTPSGVPAIEELLFEGVNVNVTLLFSLSAHQAVADAHERALRRRREAGRPLGSVASVASFFLSRIDVLVDGLLSHRVGATHDGGDGAASLFGSAAIASAKRAWRHFEERTARPDWAELAAAGARPQRLLWASTSTKNPLYDPVRYVMPLIGPETVNTMPESTIEAFARSAEEIRPGAIREGREEADLVFERLATLGIDMDAVCAQLVDEGADKFLQPFDRLLGALLQRRRELLPRRPCRLELLSGAAREAAAGPMLDAVAEQRFGPRLAARDVSLWNVDPGPEAAGAIRNRLGWLDAAERAAGDAAEITAFAGAVREEGVGQVVVLAGAEASAAVSAFTGGRAAAEEGWPALLVLDTADPDGIRDLGERLDPTRTLFLVASPSGTEALPLALYRHFREQLAGPGTPGPGARFVALTRTASPLAREAQEAGARRVFETAPGTGDRFAALDVFGLLPAALSGIDLERVVASARDVAVECGADVPDAANPGVRLGIVLAASARAGRDRLVLAASRELAGFSSWVERLVAGSLGPAGIVPVAGAPLPEAATAGPDRLYVRIALDGGLDGAAGDDDRRLEAIGEAGHPVIRTVLPSREAIGGEIVRWQRAVAVAGALLGLDPFTGTAADRDRRIAPAPAGAPGGTGDGGEGGDTGANPEPIVAAGGVDLHVPGDAGWSSGLDRTSFPALLRGFVDLATARDHVSVAAYLPTGPGVDRRLAELRDRLRGRTGAVTTLRRGESFPPFPMAGPGNPSARRVLTLLLTADVAEDLAVPGAPFGFAGLRRAMARDERDGPPGRSGPVLHANLGWHAEEGLDELLAALA